MFLILLNQILKMLLLMLLGAFCYKKKLIDQHGNEMIAGMLMWVINPVVIFLSSQTEYSQRLVKGLLLSYLLAVCTHLLMIAVGTVLVKKDSNPDYPIERFSIVYSNCGFIGVPLVQSILGSEGVLYLSAYMTVWNLFAWTHGLVVMTGRAGKKDILKGLTSPALFACISGLVFFFLQIRLPDVVGDTLNYVGGMNTPLAMMITGISVVQTDLLSIIRKKRIYLAACGKLILMPALVLAGLFCLKAFIPAEVAYTTLVCAACPAAGSCTAFALMFHKNYKYASEINVFTSISCVVTITFFMFLAERMLG